jgi:hypothetical protein
MEYLKSELLALWTCPSSGILKDIKEHNVSETDLFPSSGEGMGDVYTV